ncbi:MAG: Signal recognition particle 54 kDa protein [Pseudomonadota bacterium]
MELKRILAKDARSANEKAVSLYGSEVMVISCNKVDNLTELIVAIDNRASVQTDATPEHTPTQAQPAGGSVSSEALTPFEDFLVHARQSAAQDIEASQRQAAVEQAKAEPAKTVPSVADALEATLNAASEEAMGRVRGQELVSLVRDEIASLRREFQLSRLHQDVAGAEAVPSTMRPLLDALIDCHVPSRLRGWLLQDVQGDGEYGQALMDMRMRLHQSLTVKRPHSLMGGIHAVVGSSGVGKTMMLHRIAMAASREHAVQDIALISYSDNKPGAWSQTQILAAQTGIDVYRARDLAALGLLVDELGDRKLILIDTPGSDPMRHAADLAQLDKHIALHAVVPAHAGIEHFQQLAKSPASFWQSLMVSKWDEMPNPWPLIDFVREHPTPISVVSDSDRSSDGIPSLDTGKLIESALTKLEEMLARNAGPGVTTSLKTPPVKISARVSNSSASRIVKTASSTATPNYVIPCLQ